MEHSHTIRLCSNKVWGVLTFGVTTTKRKGVTKQKNIQQHYSLYTLTLMFKGLHIWVCDEVGWVLLCEATTIICLWIAYHCGQTLCICLIWM